MLPNNRRIFFFYRHLIKGHGLLVGETHRASGAMETGEPGGSQASGLAYLSGQNLPKWSKTTPSLSSYHW